MARFESVAVVLREPKNAVIEKRVIEAYLEKDEVLVRMLNASICGTDYSIFEGHIMPKKLPIILGHEGVGEVVRTGPKVRGVSVGDRVVIDPNIYCGVCEICRAGNVNLCPSGGLLGREADGVLTDYIILPEKNLFKLHKSIDLRIASIIQPLSTVVHAQKQVNIQPGKLVVVSGAGSTGLMHIGLAKARGGYVIALSTSPQRLEIAKRYGADEAFTSKEDLIKSVSEKTDGLGADIFIEASGLPDRVQLGVTLLKPGGALLIFGTATKPLELSMYDLYFKEIKIYNTRSSVPSDFIDSIRIASQGIIDLRSLISNVINLKEVPEHLKNQIEKRKKPENLKELKTVITWETI